MANDTEGIKEEAVTETQQSAMPTDEQQTTQVSDVSEGGQATEQPKETQSEDKSLPESASERTREQFDKLREQLREERERRQYFEQVFSSMQSQQPVQEAPMQPIYNPDTGLLNEVALTQLQKEANEAKQRADRAEKAVAGYLQDQENRETFAEFPELNPDNDKHDKTFHRLVRSVLIDSSINPQDYGNKQMKFVEAARFVKEKLSNVSNVEDAKKQGAKEALEQLTPKEQASLGQVGSPSRRGEVESDLDLLRKRTQKGDRQASIERFKRIEGQA